MAVRFYDQDVASRLKDKRKLSTFVATLIRRYRQETTEIDLTYIFCRDEYLLEINKEFLRHDTFTDIITFDMSDGAGKLTGEIYISIERIAENAIKFNTGYSRELHRVIFHGALHLCGFKDKKSADKERMTRQENTCLNEYFGE